jgi:hypothetical protein
VSGVALAVEEVADAALHLSSSCCGGHLEVANAALQRQHFVGAVRSGAVRSGAVRSGASTTLVFLVLSLASLRCAKR